MISILVLIFRVLLTAVWPMSMAKRKIRNSLMFLTMQPNPWAHLFLVKFTQAILTSLADVDELRSATKLIKRKYRKAATWLMPEAELTTLEELKDGDGKPLVGTVEKGGFKTFLGYPVEVCEELSAGAIYFGDFKRGMAVVDHTSGGGAVVDRVTEKGQVKYYSYQYSAAMLVDHKALVKLK